MAKMQMSTMNISKTDAPVKDWWSDDLGWSKIRLTIECADEDLQILSYNDGLPFFQHTKEMNK